MIIDEIKENFLNKIEFLPDGTWTDDQKTWLKAWGEFIGREFVKGKINLYEVEGFNEDTGEVPNTFIVKVYEEAKRAH